MALIQFTRNHSDHSTDKGYQFEFFCDRCGNGFMSEFKASAAGYATSFLRAAGDVFGGVFGSASAGTYEIQRAIAGPAHDKAFRECIEETKPHFRQCPKCAKWVCLTTCWNQPRSLCYECAPDVETGDRRRPGAGDRAADPREDRAAGPHEEHRPDERCVGALPGVRRANRGGEVLSRVREAAPAEERVPPLRDEDGE